jgi:4-hydroxybenzoate polyprenyltransferase
VRDWLRLLRVPLAPTAAFDAVACLLLAREAAGLGPGGPGFDGFALVAVSSLLVYFAGMVGNDLADRRRDRALAPDRPLPSGRIRPAAAAVVALLCAAGGALLGGGPAGSRDAVLVALAAAALYDFLPRGSVLAGAGLMATVRFANASIGAWPLVLSGAAPPSALLAPAAVGLYSAAATVLSATEEAPSRRRAVLSRPGSRSRPRPHGSPPGAFRSGR